MGYTVVKMWECDWTRIKKNDRTVSKFLQDRFGRKDYRMTEEQIIQKVKGNELFGSVCCSLKCPDENISFYSEMAPIFRTVDLDVTEIGEHMRAFEGDNIKKRKTLVGGLKARNILLATPLLKFYLDIGMEVVDISMVIEYDSSECFKTFTEHVTNTRRQADEHAATKIHADTAKLLGNSAYGSLLMRVDRHKNIKYTSSHATVSSLFNNKHFSRFNEISDKFYEVEMKKSSIRYDLPIQLGFTVLQYAKLWMLQFYYNFLLTYIPRNSFELCQMDTDSCYMAIAKNTLHDCVYPHLQNKFDKILKGNCNSDITYAPTLAVPDYYLVRTCCKTHNQYDNRTPGLFKLECLGSGIISLCSKCYCVKTVNGVKFSSKGVNKNAITQADLFDVYKSTLITKEPLVVKNRGKRQIGRNVVTYELQKRGLSYSYWKRIVQQDGISTKPLNIWL